MNLLRETVKLARDGVGLALGFAVLPVVLPELAWRFRKPLIEEGEDD